ncbi:MAG: hypothetical protein ABI925_03365 [Verrucomicrobiota bacterium]
MKRLVLTLGILYFVSTWAFGGPEAYSGKEMKQVAPPPCQEFYADSEWNISLWGAVAFGGDNNNDFDEDSLTFVDGETVHFDNSIGDFAGGGGIDIKYFSHRYFGMGLEAYGLAGDSNGNHVSDSLRADGLDPHDGNSGVGAVKGTFTLRYPFHCSRFSPYLFAGGGVLFGGEHETFVLIGVKERWERRSGHDARALGQVGGGFEVRFTPHIGFITDASWNVTDDEDFGMVKAGINFAF